MAPFVSHLIGSVVLELIKIKFNSKSGGGNSKNNLLALAQNNQ